MGFGLGAAIGPYVMGLALSGGAGWAMGYRYIGIIQIALTAILAASLPLWRVHKGASASAEAQSAPPLTLPQVFRIPGAKQIMAAFFCYCALEQTAILWASTYLNQHKGIPAETAAGYAGMFFIGITAGRALSGFLTMKLSDPQMIRLGQGIIALGILAMLLPLHEYVTLAGLVLVGLGCTPIYPCVIHSTPDHFGADKSQAVIGVQMASAYVGNCVMPPLFGLIAAHISAALLPVYLLAILAVMVLTHEALLRRTGHGV